MVPLYYEEEGVAGGETSLRSFPGTAASADGSVGKAQVGSFLHPRDNARRWQEDRGGNVRPLWRQCAGYTAVCEPESIGPEPMGLEAREVRIGNADG